MNYASATATSAGVAASQTASVSAGNTYQVVGFSGASSDQAVSVVLKFGSTAQLTLYGALGTSIGHYFGDNGPICPAGTAMSVVTTLAASGTGSANLIYRIRN